MTGGGGDNRGVGELPGGTITMLFTDIEGSTALLSRLGDRYAEALSAHRVLMRAAMAAWHGREISTEGDSFFVVFESAADALGCCLAAQRALAGHDWPGGLAVRVRMGLHSGEPAQHEDNYLGMDVHRAARIAATAHGGQVVLSDPTRLLAASRLPDGASVRDLGFHRLKDIEEAERIYQLVAPGLQEDFPPLKSLGTPASLPAPATPLVGRSEELDRLCAAVRREQVRLVTLTGTGGVGKTRLALAAAAALDHAFPHGVYFVALAAVRDAEIMWKTLADSLDVSADGPVAGAVTGYLAGRRTLLVLDNLEQLDGAAGVVAALLAAAPGVVVLATSRGPLHLPGEHEQPVPPLEIPGRAGLAAVSASAAAQLFAQQAGMARPGFTLTEDNAADIAAICGRLDGLPLAIELAAARVRLLSPKALHARLRQSLELPAGVGRPLRQQTLRNTVAWSYELLDPDAAGVFRRISVFAGGCDLDALAAVALPAGDPLEVVAGLLDVSLITVTEGADGEPRAGMLETIREYARERLARDDDPEGTRRRHAEHYLEIAERAQEQLEGPGQLAALDRLEADHDNLRAALAVGRFDRAGEVLREALALDTEHGDLWGMTVNRHTLALVSLRAGRPAEARDLLCGIFDHVASSGNTALLVNTLELAAGIMAGLGDAPPAARLAGAAEAIRQESGMLLTEPEAVMLEEVLAPARASCSPEDWDVGLAAGRELPQAGALALLLTLSPARGASPAQPSALRRYRRTASGAKTTSITADQHSTASSGCCSGQEWIAAAGFGLPNSLRHAVAIADIGFHSAIGCSHPGMPWMGTNAQEMKIIGRKRMNPACWAASGLRSAMPRQMPAQVNAYPNSRASANAAITSAALVCTRQPMARPTPATTTAPIIWVSNSAIDRAASTAQRDMGSERNLSISPVDMSVTIATATPGAVWARPIPSIPPIRYSW